MPGKITRVAVTYTVDTPDGPGPPSTGYRTCTVISALNASPNCWTI
jgi:hypothetical protein